jgi:hypothetical protein
MDERDIVRSAITSIDKAKTELEYLTRSNLSEISKIEFGLAYQSLNESASHCLGIFGPATIKDKKYL